MTDKNFFVPSQNGQNFKSSLSIASRLVTTTAILGAAFAPNVASAANSSESQTAKDAKTLPTITVVDSNADEGYRASESGLNKMTGPLRDAPRTVTTVTRQLMDDQGLTKVADALRNVPGISLAAGEGSNQGDNLMIRGFSARNDFFVDGMRDFGNYFRDSFNLESVEVVQGPSSVLFGRGSTGGVVQQNSKQAFLGSKREGTFQIGTNDTVRLTADVNEKISDHAAFRLNAVTHSNKVAQRDGASYSRNAIAPTLSFGLGTKTRFNINYLHQDEKNTPDYGIPFYAGKPAEVNRQNFYGFENDDHLNTTVDIATAKFEHDFSQDFTFRNQTRYARYLRDVSATEPQMTNSATTVTRGMKIRRSLETYLGNIADLTSKFETFGAKHTLITGFVAESETSAPAVLGYENTTTNAQIPTQAAFNYGAVTTTSVNKTKIDTLAVYALDTIKLGKNWELSGGVRYDNLQTDSDTLTYATNTRSLLSQTDNLTSYSLGAVYKPAHNGSIYINHGTSFNPSAESISLSVSNSNLEPEKNKITEVGTKWDLLKKRLSTTFAVFRAEKTNARETLNATTSILSGNQQVDGALVQVSGKITDKWNVMAGYTYMDGKVTKSAVNPTYVNRPLNNVPQHSLSLFSTYTLPSNIMIGGGANFMTERFTSPTSANDPVTGNLRNMPSYLIFNAMAKFPVNKNMTIQLNVNNLTNEYYYDQIRGNNAVVPGEGRVFLLTTNFKF